MIKKFINKTFGLRDGEIYISFLMQLYIFIIITVLLIVKPTVNALFLSKLGADHLPYGYLLVAGVAVSTTYLYNRAIRNFSLLKVTITSLIIFSLGFLTLSSILHFEILSNILIYVYYIGVSLFAVIATSQFWILANMVFNAREGKRLFGFIGAGAIAGGVVGGYITSIITTSFGNKFAILLAGILILFCIPIIQKVWRLRIREMNTYIRKQRTYNDTNEQVSSFKLISKSKHLVYLALTTGIGVIVAKLVDFQFSDFANTLITNVDDLASFFGFWFSTFNVIALLLQLFVTNRFLSRFGVSSTLLVLPLGIALGSLLFLTFPELWVLIIIKGFEGSFKQSLNKAAVELSIMPIPYHIKSQAKSFIDVAVDSIATGIAGFMLIFLIRKLDLSTSYITVIVLFFVFVWIVLIYRLREAYFESFRKNLQNSLSNQTQEKRRKETTISTARYVFANGSPEDILTLLEKLGEYKLVALKSSIITLLDHPYHQVKAAAIHQLFMYEKGTALDKVVSLIAIKDDRLVYACLNYIIHHTNMNESKFFKKYLDHSSDYIANAALLCLAKEATGNRKFSEEYELELRIEKQIQSLKQQKAYGRKESIAIVLLAIAYADIKKYYSFISSHLNNRHPFITKQAIAAAGITSNEQFIKELLLKLTEKSYRKASTKALRNYGPEITKTIVRLDKQENIGDTIKVHIPRVIESFNTQGAISVLIRLLSSNDVIIRLEAAKSLLKLRSKNESLVFNIRVLKRKIIKESTYYRNTMIAIDSIKTVIEQTPEGLNKNLKMEIDSTRQNLVDVLEEQLDTSLQCIFKLLSLIYDQSDIDVTYFGLLSDVKETKINALEFLDNLLKSQLKSRILPLIEYTIIDKNADIEQRIKLNLLSEKQYTAMLIKKRGQRIKIEVLHLVKALRDPSYLPLIQPLTKHLNIEVQFYAQAIKTSLIKDKVA
ncbi:Npt1/Npt2 family nucleotide transporter [uncultured Dokdonia sp.]|uniref:Npt1/Npt2 family nucleotide transporter n=1 Tax=uncultured Dokdonia sp. TaxID=575653 RepID=UPI00260BBF7F|nr:Npt1/Npt2 family nucleotide transporter [uncultured Dokdonia sp.]